MEDEETIELICRRLCVNNTPTVNPDNIAPDAFQIEGHYPGTPVRMWMLQISKVKRNLKRKQITERSMNEKIVDAEK